MKNSNRKELLKAIIPAGLLAGVLDGIAATIQTALSGSDNPIRVFNFVASGVFGEAALSGGSLMTFYGILFHLAIAMIWAILLFFIYPSVQKIIRNWLISGLLYGAFVWTCMNLIVLPLSNIPAHTFTVRGVVIGMLIIMVCIGLPIAYLTDKFFEKKNRRPNL